MWDDEGGDDDDFRAATGYGAESSGPTTCPSCGSTDIISDPSVGSVCGSCSTVIEDDFIVNATQFSKQNDGSSRANGQFVGEFSAAYSGLSGGGDGLLLSSAQSSRLTMLSRMKGQMGNLAESLSLGEKSTFLVESAFRLFTLAQHRAFLKGRNARNVAAVCLYIACRKEKVARFLIDFSGVLRVNVFDLSKVYFALKKLFKMQIPPIDAMSFIERYAVELQFEDKTSAVCTTARRIVKRLKKDFINEGRRPAGICGAALLLAAKVHGFNRSVDEVVEVVKISQVTLKSRLQEFEQTPSARLTAADFMRIDLPAEEMPPSFKKTSEVKLIADQNTSDPSNFMEDGDMANSETAMVVSKITEKRKKKLDAFYASLDEELRSAIASAETLALTIDIGSVNNDKDNSDENEIPEFDEDFTFEQFENLETNKSDALILNDELNGESDTDDEVNNALLNEDEEKAKTALWKQMNDEFVQKQQVKQQLSNNPNNLSIMERKRQRNEEEFEAKEEDPEYFHSAAEAMQNLMKKNKKLSEKIDYDKWDDLFNIDVSNS